MAADVFASSTTMDLLTGNAYDQDTGGTGWLIGFSEWTRLPGSDLLHVPADQPVTGLCFKWYDHPEGHASGDKPVSVGRTFSLLATAGSVFRYEISTDPGYASEATRTVVLQRPGDYIVWGPGIYHRWTCERRSTILTVRWVPAGEEG